MRAELWTLMLAWWSQRQVQRATNLVVAATAVSLAWCGWRIRTDGSTVLVVDLFEGHRYLLIPASLVVLVAVGVAGSVASWNGASGWSAVVAATGSSTWRGWRTQILAGGAAAAGWATATSAVVVLAATGTVAALGGGGSGAEGIRMGLAAALVVLVGVTAGSLATLVAAIGTLLPGRSLPAMLAPLVLVAAEVVVLVASDGATDLVGGASLPLLLGGVDQARAMGIEPHVAVRLRAAVWIAMPVGGLVLVELVERTKGIG